MKVLVDFDASESVYSETGYFEQIRHVVGQVFFPDVKIKNWKIEPLKEEELQASLTALVCSESHEDTVKAVRALCGLLGLPEPEWDESCNRYVFPWEQP